MKPAFKALLLLGMLLPALLAHASKAPWEEYEKNIEKSGLITGLGDSPFGEEVDLAYGSLSFSAIDVALPGSNALAVEVKRKFSVFNRKGHDRADGVFADWELDAPRLEGVFAYDWPNARCTGNGVPPVVEVGSSGNPKYFYPDDYWQGVQAIMPAGGAMLLAASSLPKPGGNPSFRWMAGVGTYFSCLSTIKNGPGEGFYAVDAAGTKYWFDWMAQYHEPLLRGKDGSGIAVYLPRRKNVLYATRIEDRYGNWVSYNYVNGHASPARLAGISSSDGRAIAIQYNQNGHLQSIATGGRTWTYQYDYANSAGLGSLTQVILPDGNKWRIDFRALASATISYHVSREPGDAYRDCFNPGDVITPGATGWITHPSGAVGEFRVEPLRHGKTNVPAVCLNYQRPNNNPNDDVSYYMMAWDSLSLVEKKIQGPGIAPVTWNYAYQSITSWYAHPSGGGYPVCQDSSGCGEPQCVSDSCAGRAYTTVTSTNGTWERYAHGNSHRYNEGKLLEVRKGSGPDQIAQIETRGYALSHGGQLFPVPIGKSPVRRGAAFSSEYIRPQSHANLQQNGVNYASQVNAFDTFARPTSETKSSSLGYTKTDTTEYHDDLNAWVLSQVKSTTTNGIETARTSFDARSLPWQQYAFGKLQQTLTYHPDGTVATVADGRGLTTSLNSWKRGIPQSIQYADGTSQSAVVDDNGWITSVTDQNGFVSQYDYDAMGRMTALFYPTGDSTAWNPVSIQFNQIPHADRGLPAGHWRQDRFEGNRHTHTYFDGLWRPVMTLDYDVASAGHNVQTQTITRYDTQGRVAFKSYPARHVGDVNASLPGTRTQYDALDRVTRVEQDSEHDPLVTTTEYLTGNSIRITNPRGHATTSHYVAYDQPAYDMLAWSAQPEGRTIEIHRDVFGKPLWMRQRAADNSVAAIRHFVYDTHQQLCKSIEPETGATVMDYDAAGNLAWTASGLSLPSTTDCNFNEAWNSGRRTDRGYNNRNRLSSLALADGRGNQQWQYTADGLPAQITTWNDPGNGAPVINAYTYNKRRLLTGESVTQPGWYSWGLGYGYNANGQLASQVYPDGFTVNYSPNALGQPTEVRDASGKPYASNVSYYPNGGMSGFTYGNGVVHGMQQNLRQLPERSIDNGVINFGYAYDAAANPTAIYDDQLGPAYHRSMQYDALDRLTAVGSASFGGDHWHRFTYNALDNLTSWTLAGVKDYAIYGYDANNRLTDIRNTAGATVVGLGYDVQGNLANKNGQQYTFDMGNRLREVPGKESYRYDGHGRRVQSTAAGTGDVLSLYSNAGTLMRQESQRTGRKENMIHLNGSLIAKQVHTTPPLPPPAAPVLTAPAQASSGDFNLSWTSVERATRYVLEENPNSAGWTALQDGAGLNRAVTGKPPGSYVYRVKACNTSGCSAESTPRTVTVPNVPVTAPTLNAPANSATGSYAISWTALVTASRYVLEENANGAGWVGIHDSATRSKLISGKGSGSYAYRAKGCNAAGCGSYSTEKTVVVAIPSQPPVQPPTITQSVSMHRGRLPEVRCGVQWTAVADAVNYELKASTGVVQYQGPNTYVVQKNTRYCAPSHVVRACNAAGCSAWSSPPFVQVEIPWTDTLPGGP